MASSFPSLVATFALLALVGFESVRTVQAQQGCGTSQRRAWRELSCQEQAAYLRGVQMLKNRGIYDELTEVHWDSRRTSHEVDAFLPWHRWFMWVFEKELQRVTGTCITVPYWDWERDSGALTVVLKSTTFGSINQGGCVRDGIAENWRSAENGRCVRREFDDDWDISRHVEVLWRITDNPDFDEFNEAIEGAPHSGPHEFIGGHMSDHWSPDDPLFYLHHSNMDRIWALWQDYHGHDEINNIDNYDWEHYSGRDMDRPMRYEGERRLDFTNPRTGRYPTPRDLLNMVNGPLVDVQYVNDALAAQLMETSRRYRNSGNNPRWITPATGVVRERCPNGITGNGEYEYGYEYEADSVTCGEEGDSCASGEDCCSEFCTSEGVCGTDCQANGMQCQHRDECCSGTCNWRGRCTRNSRRHLVFRGQSGEGGMERHTSRTLLSSDAKLQARWIELIEMYPDDEGKVLETLAREDCDERAKAAHHEIRSASREYMEKVARINNTHVFECHYVRER